MERTFTKKRATKAEQRLLRPNMDYHLFTHAIGGLNPFATDDLKQAWIDTVRRRLPGAPVNANGPDVFTDIGVLAVATMGNHPHLVAGQGEDPTAISRFMGNCLRAFALRYNHITGHRGQVFSKSYEYTILPDRGALCRAIAYVHRNPKKPELISRNTSHPQYLAEDESTFVDVRRGLNAFGGRDAYAEYFESYCRHKDAEDAMRRS